MGILHSGFQRATQHTRDVSTHSKMRCLLILIFVSTLCFGQSDLEKKLIGQWELISESKAVEIQLEPLSESEIDSLQPKTVPIKTTLTFKSDMLINIDQNGNKYNSTYKLTDSILTIGNRKYILIDLTQKNMTYRTKVQLFDKFYDYQKVE